MQNYLMYSVLNDPLKNLSHILGFESATLTEPIAQIFYSNALLCEVSFGSVLALSNQNVNSTFK